MTNRYITCTAVLVAMLTLVFSGSAVCKGSASADQPFVPS